MDNCQHKSERPGKRTEEVRRNRQCRSQRKLSRNCNQYPQKRRSVFTKQEEDAIKHKHSEHKKELLEIIQQQEQKLNRRVWDGHLESTGKKKRKTEIKHNTNSITTREYA